MSPLAIKWLVISLLIVAAGVAGWTKGYQMGSDRLVDYIGKQAAQTEKLRAVREKIVIKYQTKIKTEVEQVFIRGQTIVEEVPVYVTQADDVQCVVPVGFVRSFNSAVANSPVTGGPSESDRSPSGVPLSTVAEVGAFNQTVCQAWKTRALAWPRFYEEQRSAKPE